MSQSANFTVTRNRPGGQNTRALLLLCPPNAPREHRWPRDHQTYCFSQTVQFPKIDLTWAGHEITARRWPVKMSV